MPRYLEIAQQLQQQIVSGQLPAGSRLASIREASEQYAASINTVRRSYELLEDWRLVSVRSKSGFVVLGPVAHSKSRPSSPASSGKACVVRTSIPVRLNSAVGNGAVPTLGPAVQSPELMPMNQINRLISHVCRYESERCHSYAAPPGSEELRRVIAARMADIGISVTLEEIVITSGAKEAVYLSIRAATTPGCIVAVESPAYYALLEVLSSLRLKVIEIATDADEGVNLDQLDHVLTKHDVKAMALCSNFSNPQGYTMTDPKKQSLCEILRRHDVTLIEDDVYGDLCFYPPRPKAFKSFDDDGRVMYCGSFSKTISPGLRLGWSIPGRLQQEVELLKLVVNQTTAMLPQLVVAEFLNSGAYDRHLRSIRLRLARQCQAALKSIEQHFPSAVKISAPAGGHVLWLELPKQVNAIELSEKALQKGIQIAPGPIFSASGGFQNYMRINCGFPWTSQLDSQVEWLGKQLKQF
jgi:DNA-binding transcriptional MocR family regulator